MHTVIFDFDGTLVDSNKVKTQSFLEFGILLDGNTKRIKSVIEKIPGDRLSIWRAFLENKHEKKFNEGLLEKTINEFNEYIDRQVVLSRDIDGSKELLEYLSAGNFEVILSSKTPLKNLIQIIEKKGWSHYFDRVYGSPSKKDDIIDSLIKSKLLNPMKTFIVGDGEDDMISAKKNNCNFFPVGNNPIFINEEKVFNLQEILVFFKKLN